MTDLSAPSEFMALLDIEFEERGPTRVVGSIAADERHHQPWGLVHGGLYTTAIESFAATGAYEAVQDHGQMGVGAPNITAFRRPHPRGRRTVVATRTQQARIQQLGQVEIRRPEDQ